MIGSTRKRDGRRMTDAEVEAADWHWIQIGQTGSAKLLTLLVEHHGRPDYVIRVPITTEDKPPLVIRCRKTTEQEETAPAGEQGP